MDQEVRDSSSIERNIFVENLSDGTRYGGMPPIRQPAQERRAGAKSWARRSLQNSFDKAAAKLKENYGSYRRTARRAMAKIVYSLPMFSRVNPRRKVTTFKKHCSVIYTMPRSTGSLPQDWYLKIRSPETVYRNPSIAVDENEIARFHDGAVRYQRGPEFQIPEVFLACLTNAKIVSRDCLVLSSENQILLESALSGPQILEANGILDRLIPPRSKRIHRKYCLISHPWSQRYYHWVIEALPRLSIVEQFTELDSVPLVVVRPLLRFQRESFELAGVRPERVVEFDGGSWQVDQLFFPQILAPSGHPSPQAVDWLRERFLESKSPAVLTHGRRIYLTRRDASQRRLLNEEEIIKYLRDKSFEIICPGEMSFAEQVNAFRNVEIVIAPHGSGATNMVFAPEGATLIEFFGDNYINGCYWALTNICRQKHAFLIGPSKWLDYSISLEKLKILLAKVCAL